MGKILKILVVDDTITYRKILKEALSGIKDVECVGTAPNGRIALKKIEQLNPDFVLLDVEMPDMDGLETLKHIKKNYRSIGVIMVSGANVHSADVTIKALEAGALDFIPKPEGMSFSDSFRSLQKSLEPILKIGSTRMYVSRIRKSAQQRKPIVPKEEPSIAPKRIVRKRVINVSSFDVLALGVSTGGPESLIKVIPKLPGDFPIPIVMVQHMPPLFTCSLAKNLNSKSQLNVKEAIEGEVIKAGTVYIAPGGKHMIIKKNNNGEQEFIVGLNSNPPVKSCRPSVDVLFRSVANAYNGGVLAVIMTGMGDDGADGVAALKRKGCYCISQSKDTCVVYGMPRAIEEAELSDEVVDLERIAERITHKLKISNFKSS